MILKDQRGQALTEYAVACFVTVMGTYLIVKGVLLALNEYYREVTTLLCLPIP